MKDNDDALLDVVLIFNGGPLGAKVQNRGFYFCVFTPVDKTLE